jgi:hypothetical protein
MRALVEYTIPNGFAVGQPIDARQFQEFVGFITPVITSGDVLIQGAMPNSLGNAPNSADFVRFLETSVVGSGQMRFATGAGSCYVPVGLQSFPGYIRLETSVTQGAQRVFQLSFK